MKETSIIASIAASKYLSILFILLIFYLSEIFTKAITRTEA